jgi:hypothetical protein
MSESVGDVALSLSSGDLPTRLWTRGWWIRAVMRGRAPRASQPNGGVPLSANNKG